MSSFSPVKAQFEAYNDHDIEAFMSCFSEGFKGYRMPSERPSTVGKESLREFYMNNRFNNPLLRAELISRIVMGNKVFDHELIYGLSDLLWRSLLFLKLKTTSFLQHGSISHDCAFNDWLKVTVPQFSHCVRSATKGPLFAHNELFSVARMPGIGGLSGKTHFN